MTRSGSLARLAVLMLLVHVACGGGPAATTTPPTAAPTVESAWLRGVVVPFSGADPSSSLDDLEPLRGMVGTARVVALGEATHGTREFFQMKHRVVRFLVERMGFTAFGIEATMPECERIDRYVRSGEGDPEVALSGQYFWTWRTEEVWALMQWMRGHNGAGGHVGFHGFDMQYPGMAIHNVQRFVRDVDEGSSVEFEQRLECLRRYANDWTGQFSSPRYEAQPAAYRDACLADLRWVLDALSEREAQYARRSSPAEAAWAVRYARLAVQYEESASARVPFARDTAMAENATWLREQLGPDGKIVLWAHNGHVATRSGAMGDSLRRTFGADMVVMGFSMGRGTFTAVGQGAVSGLSTFSAGDPKPASYEDYFWSTGQPQFLLDLRHRDAQSPDVAWLFGPRSVRSIGCCYDPAHADNYWYAGRLPQEYDVLIYFDKTNPSRLLRYVAPTSF